MAKSEKRFSFLVAALFLLFARGSRRAGARVIRDVAEIIDTRARAWVVLPILVWLGGCYWLSVNGFQWQTSMLWWALPIIAAMIAFLLRPSVFVGLAAVRFTEEGDDLMIGAGRIAGTILGVAGLVALLPMRNYPMAVPGILILGIVLWLLTLGKNEFFGPLLRFVLTTLCILGIVWFLAVFLFGEATVEQTYNQLKYRSPASPAPAATPAPVEKPQPTLATKPTSESGPPRLPLGDGYIKAPIGTAQYTVPSCEVAAACWTYKILRDPQASAGFWSEINGVLDVEIFFQDGVSVQLEDLRPEEIAMPASITTRGFFRSPNQHGTCAPDVPVEKCRRPTAMRYKNKRTNGPVTVTIHSARKTFGI